MFSDTKEIPDGCRNRGNGRNLNASIGCQVNEADRPVKRLRRKRRLLLESEDDEENAYEDEAALHFTCCPLGFTVRNNNPG